MNAKKSHRRMPLGFISFVYKNYTRSTRPDLRARAETQTRLGLPSTRIRTFCTFTPQVRFVLLSACERLLPDLGDLPVT